MSEITVRPNAVRLADVTPERLTWLSPGRLAAGKLTVLDGDPGLGKSTLLTDWSARLSTGRPLPESAPGRSRGVVLMSAEDGLGDTIRPRLEAAGADLDRVVALLTIPDGTPEGRFPELPRDIPYIRELVERVNAALVIIDPLMAYLGGRVNSWRDQDIRRALAPLATMADDTGTAVVLVRHLNKAQSTSALYRGGGSIGIIGAARSGLLVAADPDDPERRILASTKSNLARPPVSLAYRLEPVPGGDVARVVYEGVSGHSAGALLSLGQDGDEGERRTALREAEDWLRDLLVAGPVPARDVMRQARADGISDRTLSRAKASLAVRAERIGGIGEAGAWRWQLPNLVTKGANSPKSANGHDLGTLGETIDSAGVFDADTPKAANDSPYGNLGVLSAPDRVPGGIWTCVGCGLPRSMGGDACPACGATDGRWRQRDCPEVA